MSRVNRRVVDKSYAYVTRDGTELLVFDPPSGESPQVPKGGVEPEETPKRAVVRELREETGLADGDVLTAVAVDEWPHPSKPKAYRRHFFHVDVDGAPEEWTHEVTGDGEDEGLVYECYWLDAERAVRTLARDQGAYLDAVVSRELTVES